MKAWHKNGTFLPHWFSKKINQIYNPKKINFRWDINFILPFLWGNSEYIVIYTLYIKEMYKSLVNVLKSFDSFEDF